MTEVEKGLLKLVVTLPGSHDKYAALTYCWGQCNWVTTTSTTLESFQSCFRCESLPQTLRDAADLTKGLGLRYLWIDALCIIQGTDSMARADWHRQVTEMDQVYRNAFVTISAAAAPNADSGLFSRGQCVLPDAHGYSCHVCPIRDSHFADEPINRRAWTLQEHLLSPRLLIFGTSGLIWQCDRALSGCSTKDTIRFPATYRYRLPRDSVQPSWSRILENFCSRDLTNTGDKLHAIAALARRYQASAMTNDRYLAGLWESSLRADLLWYHHPNWFGFPKTFSSGNKRPSEYRAPTWSWASMDASITFPSQNFPERYGWLTEASCEVELSDPNNRFGAVTSGWLTLRGPLVQSRIRWSARKASLFQVPVETLTGDWLGDLWLDDEEQARTDSPERSSIWCIVMLTEPHLIAIALRHCPDAWGCYTRVGLVHTSESHRMNESRKALGTATTETVVVM